VRILLEGVILLYVVAADYRYNMLRRLARFVCPRLSTVQTRMGNWDGCVVLGRAIFSKPS